MFWLTVVGSMQLLMSTSPAQVNGSIELLGRWTQTAAGSALKVAVVGNYAYLANGMAGLQIINISNPTAPFGQSSYSTPGEARCVQVQGQYAYVTWNNQQAGTSGLAIVDVTTNPWQPTGVGNYETTNFIYSSDVVDRYAYLAGGYFSDTDGVIRDVLTIVDLSDPVHPRRVGGYDSASGFGSDVQVKGGFAYVRKRMRWGDFVEVLDVTNPASPTHVPNADTSGILWDSQIVGNYRYKANGTDGLQVIDLSKPDEPTVVGSYETDGEALNLVVTSRLVFVADGSGGLAILQMPGPLAILMQPPATYTIAEGQAVSLFVGAFGTSTITYQWFLGQRGDTSRPLAQATSSGFTSDPLVENTSFWVRVTNNEGSLSSTTVNVAVVPRVSCNLIGSWPGLARNIGAGEAQGLVLKGDYVYLADGEAGLQVIDVSDRSKPIRVSNFRTGDEAMGVTVSGNYAYVARWGGIEVIHVGNPNNPAFVNFLNAWVASVAANELYLYTGDYYKGFRVFDLRTPAAPTEVNITNLTWTSVGVVNGDFAYTAAWGVGVQVFDVTDRQQPILVQSIGPGYGGYGEALSGRYRYVYSSGGFQVLDASLRSGGTPEVGHYSFGGGDYHGGVVASGEYAYVAADKDGLAILQITPAPPLLVPRFGDRALSLSWRRDSGMKLQRTASLLPANWQDVPGSETTNSVVVPTTEAAGFFRLAKP